VFYTDELIMRFWSISTTVRNPERIRSFLKILQMMEGEVWTIQNQRKFQILLIQYKVYGFGEPKFHKTLTEQQNEWLYSDFVSYQQAIEETASKLLTFREEFESIRDEEKRTEYKLNYFKRSFSNYEAWNNAVDYVDNIIRYFRLTRYIYVRGNGFYIDIEPRRVIEVDNLLKFDDASSMKFASKEEYIKYIGNIELPVLPWEEINILNTVINNIQTDVTTKHAELSKLGIELSQVPLYDISSYSNTNAQKIYISQLREYRRYLFERENHFYSQSIENIQVYITQLDNIFKITKSRPVELERIITYGLNALNDAIDVKPNYPVGDDNEPTFTAPANKPDVECFYQSFNAICEVTLLTNRSQWYNEGQPVMRHIRDFENIYSDKDTYCLFIAPKLHRDTINTFWISVKYEYEGRKQKIIPLSISQFVLILNFLKEYKEKNVFLSHHKIKQLYDSIIEKTEEVTHSYDWIQAIPTLINNWGKSNYSQS